jgi:hypothetical protein
MNPTVYFLFPIPGTAFDPWVAAVDVYALSPGRLGAITAALLGLAGAIIGGMALRRQSRGIGTGRRGAVVALAAGLMGLALGLFVVVTSSGGVGTGNGRGGAYVAVMLGTIALAVAGRALGRSRRTP